MAKILVTGAAGFIGSHTVDLLLAEGHEVTGIDNLRTGSLGNFVEARRSSRFRVHEHDVTEPGWLQALTSEFAPDAMIHLAALVSVPDSFAQPELNRRLNFDSTRIVIEAALARGSTCRIVYASSAAVYGASDQLPLAEDSECRPISPYGQAKLDSENLLLQHSREHNRLTVQCLRYFNVYGARQDPASPYTGVISRFHETLRRGETPVIFGDGEQTRDFIAVQDVARANLIAATAKGLTSGVANICTGHARSMRTLLASMTDALGLEISPAFGPPRKGDIRHSRGSTERARSTLGFVAQVPLREGLRSLV